MEYYSELRDPKLVEFTELLREVYEWVNGQENIGTRAFSGIIINRNNEDVSSQMLLMSKFPDLDYYLERYRLNCDIAFFLSGEVSNKLKKGLPPHIDGSFENPKVTLVLPLFGCTTETTTYWVNYTDEMLKASKDSKKYEFKLLRKMNLQDLDILDSTSILSPSIIRTNVFHLVQNHTRVSRCLVSLRFKKFGIEFEEAKRFLNELP